MSLVSEYNKLETHKMMPEQQQEQEEIETRVSKTPKKNKNSSSKRQFTSSPLAKRQFNYKPNEKDDKYIVKEVEVVYEEVSSVGKIQDQIEAQNQKNTKNTKNGKIKSEKDNNMIDNFEPAENGDEYLVKMEKSFNQDVKRASNRKHQQGVAFDRNTIKIEDKNDETLDLSPIHKSDKSFSEKSVDVENEYEEDYQHEVHYDIDQPIKFERLNSEYKRPKRKYKYYDPKTDQISPE